MIFVTWWTFQKCCSLLGMLGIFGEVGRPNSMKPLPGPKFLKSKVFENKFFRSLLRLFLRPKFSRPISETFFETKVFETDTETFFETKYFRDPYRDFCSRLNIFETDTETFFRDQMFSRPIPRLFFETKIFEIETDTLKKLRKVSIPRSLETRCHTLLSSRPVARGQNLGREIQ